MTNIRLDDTWTLSRLLLELFLLRYRTGHCEGLGGVGKQGKSVGRAKERTKNERDNQITKSKPKYDSSVEMGQTRKLARGPCTTDG